MKKTIWIALLALVGLLALALALNPAASRQPQAQGPAWGTEQEELQPAAAAAPSSSSEEMPDQAELDWPHSTEPGYVPSQGGPAEPEDELNASAYLRVAGSVLRPRQNDVDYDWGHGGGCIYVTLGDVWTVWNTPLYLPQGATVKALRMYVDDTSTLYDTAGSFTVYDLYGNIVDEWWAASSGNAGTGYFDVWIPNHVIDYSSYSYVLNWRPQDNGSDMQLCGFRIFYKPPPGYTFLPNVLRNYP